MRSETKLLLFVGAILLAVVGLVSISVYNPSEPGKVEDEKVKKFGSYGELKGFLKKNAEESEFGYGRVTQFEASAGEAFGKTAGAAQSSGGARADEYSRTNIQVAGVDEPDIVKNDGKYIYTLTGNNVVIVDAFPASNMKILSEIKINGSAHDIFINEDKLIVFADRQEKLKKTNSVEGADEESVVYNVGERIGMAIPSRASKKMTAVYIYDISNRANPKIENEILIDGGYQHSRMIGDYVYVISSQYVYGKDPILPVYRINGIEKEIAIDSVYYFDFYDDIYSFNIIGAISVINGEFSNRVYLTGSTRTLYVSENNIYLTGLKRISGREYAEKSIREIIVPLLPDEEKNKVLSVLDSDKSINEKMEEANGIVIKYSDSLSGDEKAEFDEKLMKVLRDFDRAIRKDSEMTVIHKIGIDKLDIDYEGKGEVPGNVLNQFSMDEYNRYFRIATTVGEVWEGDSVNNVYVLDENMNVVGKLEDLAPGERIYSARFIGDRAYLVTFKKVDPFYVIDLSDVDNPSVLGYLKIPGYSDYLHPYDEDHIIGIGKEAIDASEDEVSGRGLDFAWFQGLKIAIFDVSDVNNPKEKAKIVVGDRGTDSYALYDHKAFLFDKKRNLLVMPIKLAEIREEYEGKKLPASTYGEAVWHGAYVFDIREDSIAVKGKISHFDSFDDTQRRYFGYYGSESIQRSLYIDNVLYTISQKKIKANGLDNLREVGKVDLPFKGKDYGTAIK